MQTIFYIVRKEFQQILRNRIMLPMIFLVPIIQLLILVNAADFEIRNINLHLIDEDLSAASRQLAGKFSASLHFELVQGSFSYEEGLKDIQADRADVVLHIPAGFERDLLRLNEASLHLTVNAINGSKAGLASAYSQAVIQDFNQNIRTEWLGAAPSGPAIDIRYRNWFNPEMDYDTFMVPGILVMLVTLVGMFLSGMNIVREKEVGTIEQINVTPIRKYQFIIGKLMPFWIIALIELALGLAVGKLIFAIPMVGSLGVVFGFAALYMMVVLGIGLLISTFTDTQQQAMFIAWFFLIIFVLMSGLFTPIESMPDWAQFLTRFNPIAYFVEVMRLVLLKGSGWWEIRSHLATMCVMALVVNGLAVWNYRKVGA